MKRLQFLLIGYGVMVFAMSGCVTIDPHVEVEEEYVIADLPEPERQGIYHKVKPGETLWRIAKTYEVSLDDVIRMNRIPSVAQIEKDQLIFIPGAHGVKDIVVDTEETKKDFIWPVTGKIIGYFRDRKDSQINKGIDIKVSDGEFVRAARSGRVSFSDYLSGYGYTVILDHEDGYYSVYARNAKILVDLGELVLKNKEIAQVARINNESILHFEIRRNSVEDNPLYYLP